MGHYSGPISEAASRDVTAHNRVNRKVTKHKTNKNMKKYIIIAAAAIIASVGVTYAANSLRNLEDQSKCEGSTKCSLCKGTGWSGSFKCPHCKGTGSMNSYLYLLGRLLIIRSRPYCFSAQMIDPPRFVVLLSLAALLQSLPAQIPDTQSSRLPSLESYFAEPSHFAERISPDGKWVAYLGPDDFGINRLWVLRAEQPEKLVRVSSSDGPSVTVFFWLGDDAILWQSSTAAGRIQLFLGTPHSSEVREILPDEKRNISLQGVVNSKEPCLLIGLSDEPSAYPDLFRLKLDGNEKPELVYQNRDQIIIWAWDRSATPVAGLRWTADGAKEILNLRGAPSKVIFRAEPTDDARLLFASADGSSVFVITNRDADLTRVESVDLTTGSRKFIASDPLGRLDVEQVIVHPKDGRILGAGFIDEPVRWQALDPAFSKLLEALNSLPDSRRMTCLGFDADLKHCLLRRLSDRDPETVHLYDVATRSMRLLWREHPKIERTALCEM
jgi:hypothetical protein